MYLHNLTFNHTYCDTDNETNYIPWEEWVILVAQMCPNIPVLYLGDPWLLPPYKITEYTSEMTSNTLLSVNQIYN